MLLMLRNIGPTEIIILLFSAGIVALIVRLLLRKNDQTRTIDTLVEENLRLRKTLDKQRGQ